MNINPDDPKWTAYVLGELNDAERTQVEKELESSAVAREVVEEIRLATDLLRQELTQEQAVGLAPEQRRAITNVASERRVRPMLRWAGVAASVAAGLLVVATLSIQSLLRSREATPPATVTAVPVHEGHRQESESRDKDKINLNALGRQKVESVGKTSQLADGALDRLQ